jgi:hypothetical protein
MVRSRIRKLAGRMDAIRRGAEFDERLRRTRVLTRMILDEFNRLKASGEKNDEPLLDKAIRSVVADQYEDLGPQSVRYIADGWIENVRGWTRIDWMINAGREGPPK